MHAAETHVMLEDETSTTKATMPDRASILDRLLPSMSLSDGSTSSMTPPPIRSTRAAAQRAASRFAVNGNAIVTGGCGGLGLEAARSLLEHGCAGVALLDLDPLATEADTDALATEFPDACVITKQVDVTDFGEADIVFAEVRRELGSVDILLCFAGISTSAMSLDVPVELFRKTIDINTTGSFLCAQLAARHMIEQKKGGRILFVSSVSGRVVCYPQPLVAYAASKAAISHVGRSLAAEWAVHGIRVNSISPGYMNTILTQGAGLAQHREIWKGHNPMGRLGEASELTGAIVLLCSQAGSYITGADIVIDGGLSVF